MEREDEEGVQILREAVSALKAVRSDFPNVPITILFKK
jgi:hypothetical protein